ncbi:MAG: AzlC family ABC transporter permease [Clostridia bacterium]|nr:AzlC family ABC transporter permease [Clostridia bacterium]
MNQYRRGLKDGVAIGLGYLSVSFSFGINAVAGGLSVLQATIISMTNLTSAGQLAGLDLMLKLAPLVELALVQLTINIRYSLMSISLTQKLDGTMTTPHRLAVSFFNTDEVFAVASSQPGLLGKSYLYGLGTMPYIGWASGTLLGAVAGSILPSGVTSALGIMIYAMFVAIVVPPAKKVKAVCFVSLVCAAMCLAFYYIPALGAVSSGMAIIICSVIAAGLGAWLYPVREAD